MSHICGAFEHAECRFHAHLKKCVSSADFRGFVAEIILTGTSVHSDKFEGSELSGLHCTMKWNDL